MRKPQPARPKVRDAFKPITSDQVSSFEQDLGISLPEDYRRFILTTNGGHCYDAHFPLIGDTLRHLYALNSELEWADLASAREASSHWIPDWLLPVGTGAGGNQYCLSLDSQSFGEIYHLMAEWLLGDLEEISQRTIVAKSFDEFLRLIELDVDTIKSECEGTDDVFLAAEIGDLEWLKVTAEVRGDALSQITATGDSLLHRAIFRCQLEVTKWLISIGQDIERRDSRGGTPLFTAVSIGSVDAVRLLVELGSDTEAVNDEGNIALMEAVANGDIRCARELWQAIKRIGQVERYRGVVLEMCEDNEDLMAHLVPVIERGDG